VLAFIKSADPSMEIHWLVEEPFAQLLEDHPLVQQVIKISTKAWRKEGKGRFIKETVRTIRSLRSENYDIVLDLQGNSKSALFTLFSGAAQRYGFDRMAVREWPNNLATNHKVSLKEDDHHISDRSLAVAAEAFPKGTDRPLAGPLPVDEMMLDAVQRTLNREGLKNDPLVVLHHGTTWDTKKWPQKNWAELASTLCDEMNLPPILTWGNEDELEVVKFIRDATSGSAVIWPKGDLCELAALLKRADVVVGTDTGPIHIAAAVGTSTVSIYRVTDSERNGPRGENHILFQSPLDCSPCLRKECERNDECAHSVGVKEVVLAISSFLENIDSDYGMR
jgi:heptosyltransferase-1